MMNARSRVSGFTSPRSACSLFRPTHAGFTLVEVILVVALLAMVVAVGWPSLDQMLIARRLTDGASQVRSFLRDARRQAMQDGISYRVDSLDAEGKLRRVPLSDPFDESLDAISELSTDNVSDEETEFEPDREEIELPNDTRLIDDMTFDVGPPDPSRKSKSDESPPDSSDPIETSEAESDTKRWRPVAEFYPDGSSIDTTLKMVDRRPWHVELSIRSLTGEVTLGEPDIWRSKQAREEENDAMPTSEAMP